MHLLRISSVAPILLWVASAQGSQMPYAQNGLSEREAAAHLLDRFTFGPIPGQVDEVVAKGLDEWLESQLAPGILPPNLVAALRPFHAWTLSDEQIYELYPPMGPTRLRGVRQGWIDPRLPKKEQLESVRALYAQKGYRLERDLVFDLLGTKIVRAVQSPWQLEEVLTDFWFNHFHVSSSVCECRRYMLTYERDAIRPYVFGAFSRMLEATAKHPAMLLFLDNARSQCAPDALCLVDARFQALGKSVKLASFNTANTSEAMNEPTGVNENYARELLELHTLGVDGGYDQEDVEETARILTGWRVMPSDPKDRDRIGQILERSRTARLGFCIEGEFFFDARLHDAGEKEVLGTRFPSNAGVEEGERLLRMLANHPSTAQHICRKLTVRFVRDDPPQELVDDLARVYSATGGDIRSVIRAIARHPAFWSEDARRAKIKSPFELAVSAIRALHGRVYDPALLSHWVRRMGQPLYRYRAPTGFPDRAEAWVDAGSLVQRMNFGMSLARDEIEGVDIDLENMPHSANTQAMFEEFARILMPERDCQKAFAAIESQLDDNIPLPQVVGLLLGSPEYQRR